MSDDFDPLYTWLGIPPSEQPSNYYRILGLNRYESNRRVIANAYEQRMVHVRNFQTGPNAVHSQKILNELSRAYTCLLNARRKALYDQHLKGTENATQTQAASWPPEETEGQRQLAAIAQGPRTTRFRHLSTYPNRRVWISLACGVALLAVIYVLAVTLLNSGPTEDLASQVVPGRTVPPLKTSLLVAATNSDYEKPVDDSKIQPAETQIKFEKTDPVVSLPETQSQGVPLVPTTVRANTAGPATTPPDSVTGAKAPLEQPHEQPISVGVRVPASPPQFALRFGGNDRLEIVNSRGLVDVQKPFTIEMWLRFSPDEDSHWLTGDLVFGPNHPEASRTNPAGWQFWIMKTEAGRQRIAVATGKGFLGEFLIKENAWRHLAVCRSENQFLVFVDGRRAAAQPVELLTAHLTPSPVNLYIGGHEYLHPTQPIAFRGDLRAYRVSSVCRYLDNFAPAELLPNDDSTSVLLDFSGDTPDAVADLSGGGHDGRVIGAKWVSLESLPSTAAVAGKPSNSPPPSNSSSVALPAAAITKRPIPEADALKRAHDEITELFQDERAEATDDKRKEVLSRKFRELAKENPDKPASQYALFDEAKSLATAIGDVQLANEIIDEAATRFELNAWSLKLESFKKAAELARTAETRKRVAGSALDFIDQLVIGGQFDLAAETAQLASSTASKAREVDLLKSIRERRDAVAGQRKRWAAAHDAMQRIKSNADDPKMNEVCGLFLALQQDEWEDAVPYLAKAAIKSVRDAAIADQQRPTDNQEQIAVANLWWDAAHAMDKKDRPAMLTRALFWYRRAEPNAKGLARVQVEKRLQEIANATPNFETKKGQKSKKVQVALPSSIEVPPGLRGLLGRVQVDGRDVGVLWKYEPGLNITDATVNGVLGQLGAPAGRLQLEFIGILFVHESAKVTVRMTGGSAKTGGAVLFVNEKKIGEVGASLQTRDQTEAIDLNPGEHSIRWVLSGAEIGTSSLNFLDAKLGKPLTVYHTPQLAAKAREQPFRARLNVDMARNP